MRIRGVFRPGDHPDADDPETGRALQALFANLFPGAADPAIDGNHAGIAIAARNPALAGQLSRFLALETGWSRRTDLRELAIQTVNLHYASHYAYRTRLPAALASGLGIAQIDAISGPEFSPLLDEDQWLVVRYARAVVSGGVPEELFGQVVARFGETGAVEFTAIVGFWAFWAMFLNATRPDPAD